MIELIYLNESKRIRREYFENLSFFTSKEEQIETYAKEIERIKSNMKDIDPKNTNTLIEKLKDIETNINNINKLYKPYEERLKQLDEDQRLLWNNIKDKYPNDDEEDIKRQIMEFIKPLNEEFRKNK